MDVAIFNDGHEFKYWIDGLNNPPKIINVIVFKDTLIVTYTWRSDL